MNGSEGRATIVVGQGGKTHLRLSVDSEKRVALASADQNGDDRLSLAEDTEDVVCLSFLERPDFRSASAASSAPAPLDDRPRRAMIPSGPFWVQRSTCAF